MPYNPNIPQANQPLSSSQSQILANFTAIDSDTAGFGVDHQQLVASADQGKHRKTTLIEWAMPPEATADPITLANEGAVYTKETASTTELYWKRENNGSVVQLTNGAPTGTVTGRSFLPGGYIYTWGRLAITSGVGQGIAGMTTIYNMTITIEDSTIGATERAYITTTFPSASFTVRTTSGAGAVIYYQAIGV